MSIIELAEQAGIKNDCDGIWCNADQLQRFAELVSAHEREECAKLCEELLERPSGYQGRWEGYGKFKSQMTGQECAEAIRERGKA